MDRRSLAAPSPRPGGNATLASRKRNLQRNPGAHAQTTSFLWRECNRKGTDANGCARQELAVTLLPAPARGPAHQDRGTPEGNPRLPRGGRPSGCPPCFMPTKEQIAAETPEQREKRLARKRENARKRKAAMTPAEREEAFRRQQKYFQDYLARLTPEEREAREARRREQSRQRFANMTPEERENHNRRNREWRAKNPGQSRQRFAHMTPEQREKHNQRNRRWRARRKERRKKENGSQDCMHRFRRRTAPRAACRPSTLRHLASRARPSPFPPRAAAALSFW